MKLPRFQFHLSTALIATLVAAILIYVNVRPRHVAYEEHRSRFFSFIDVDEYGWPFAFFLRARGRSMAIGSDQAYQEARAKELKRHMEIRVKTTEDLSRMHVLGDGLDFDALKELNYSLLAANAGVAFTLVLTCAWFFEKLMTRRTRRTTISP